MSGLTVGDTDGSLVSVVVVCSLEPLASGSLLSLPASLRAGAGSGAGAGVVAGTVAGVGVTIGAGAGVLVVAAMREVADADAADFEAAADVFRLPFCDAEELVRATLRLPPELPE